MHNGCCHSSFLFHGFYFLDPSWFCIPHIAVLLHVFSTCVHIYIYICSYKRRRGQESVRRCASITPVMGTDCDMSPRPAALPKMTEAATSDSSQPLAATSDKANHAPGYVSWNVAARCEASSLLYGINTEYSAQLR